MNRWWKKEERVRRLEMRRERTTKENSWRIMKIRCREEVTRWRGQKVKAVRVEIKILRRS